MNISETIEDSEIESNKTVTFGIGMNMTEEVPFPKFAIDGKRFNLSEITHTVNASSASAWKLASTVGFHPFHIQ
jgi:FtsP/CotA-like multicopper oxidase with cupredoxin domain